MIEASEFVKKFRSILSEELDIEEPNITIESRQVDVANWDSLAHVRLVMRVEREYDVQFEVEEIESISSVREFYDAVVRHLTP